MPFPVNYSVLLSDFLKDRKQRVTLMGIDLADGLSLSAGDTSLFLVIHVNQINKRVFYSSFNPDPSKQA